jgi:hypothetical protein
MKHMRKAQMNENQNNTSAKSLKVPQSPKEDKGEERENGMGCIFVYKVVSSNA